MNEPPESRLAQKLKNFERSLAALKRSIAAPITEPRDLSGIIKDFEIVYELSWKTLKASLENDGHKTTTAKNVFSEAYQVGWIDDESVWLEMIQDRNQTVHIYDESLARDLCQRIQKRHFPALEQLHNLLKSK